MNKYAKNGACNTSALDTVDTLRSRQASDTEGGTDMTTTTTSKQAQALLAQQASVQAKAQALYEQALARESKLTDALHKAQDALNQARADRKAMAALAGIKRPTFKPKADTTKTPDAFPDFDSLLQALKPAQRERMRKLAGTRGERAALRAANAGASGKALEDASKKWTKERTPLYTLAFETGRSTLEDAPSA